MSNEMRLTDVNALIVKMCRACNNECCEEPCEPGECFMYDAINNAPTVDAKPVVHGRWLYDSGSERHFCSACNEYALSATTQEQVADYDWEENLVVHLETVTKEFWTDYCPNCGADMRDGYGNA